MQLLQNLRDWDDALSEDLAAAEAYINPREDEFTPAMSVIVAALLVSSRLERIAVALEGRNTT